MVLDPKGCPRGQWSEEQDILPRVKTLALTFLLVIAAIAFFVVLGWDTVRRVFQIVVFEAVSELVLAAGRRRIRTTGNPLCRVIHTFSNPGFTDSIMWIGFALVLGVAAES